MSNAGPVTPESYAGGALLVVDGELPDTALIEQLCAAHAPVVATDGAALRLRDRSMLPDVVIGDLDSVGDEASSLAAAGVEIIRVESQETNDLEKALAWLAARGTASATLIGVAGKAVDHTLNNFSVIARFARLMRLRLIDDHSIAYLVPDTLRLPVQPGDRISLIPLPAATITTSGLAWPLHHEQLAIGLREGASNRAVEPVIELHVHEGLVLVYHHSIFDF